MKLYSNKSGASIKMNVDEEFKELVSSVIKANNIQSIFETGTYLGTGSTFTLAQLLIENNKIPKNFITVEANKDYYIQATFNLAKYKFINPVFGLSVDFLEAVKFLVNDEIFDKLHEYEDVYIDHLVEPKHHYLQEILIGIYQDKFFKNRSTLINKIFKNVKEDKIGFRNNLLYDFIENNMNSVCLFLLDSAAGIGYFEFLEVVRLMGKREYFLILDDIDHLKHFRSKAYIENNTNKFEILGCKESSGWLVAKSLV